MSQTLASPANCCSPCADAPAEQLVGPRGKSAYQVALDDGFVGTEAQWLASLDGADGKNSYTILAAFTAPSTGNFVQPGVGATIIATVGSSGWAVIGEDAVLEGGGYYLVTAIPDATHITLQNRGYAGAASPGAPIAIGSRLAPSGQKGTTGTAGTGSGDMLSAANLAVGATGVANASTALTNLGGSVVGKAMFSVASPSAIRFIRIDAANTVTLRAAADMRDDLDVVPGTDVQVFDAFLTSIATLGTAADKMIYTTGANVATETGITALARTFVGLATAALQRAALGKVLPRYGLLASKSAVDLNAATSDNAITVESARYRLDKIIVDNASVNLTTATLGVFTAAGGAGTTVVADQAIAALTASSKFMDLTLAGGVTADVLTAGTLYVRVGTAQGVAATANVWLFGYTLE